MHWTEDERYGRAYLLPWQVATTKYQKNPYEFPEVQEQDIAI
jgi:hypothetical protein